MKSGPISSLTILGKNGKRFKRVHLFRWNVASGEAVVKDGNERG